MSDYVDGGLCWECGGEVEPEAANNIYCVRCLSKEADTPWPKTGGVHAGRVIHHVACPRFSDFLAPCRCAEMGP